MSNNKKELMKIVTVPMRLSFPNIHVPKAYKEKEPTYSCTLLAPKNADLKELNKKTMQVALEEFGPKEEWPEGLKFPIRNGDKKKDLEGFPGNYFIRCSARKKPQLFNMRKEPVIVDDGTFYSGCWVHASLLIVPFNHDNGMSTGVRYVLLGLLKARDDKEFAGGRSIKEDFSGITVEDDSENPDNYLSEEDEDLSSLGI